MEIPPLPAHNFENRPHIKRFMERVQSTGSIFELSNLVGLAFDVCTHSNALEMKNNFLTIILNSPHMTKELIIKIAVHISRPEHTCLADAYVVDAPKEMIHYTAAQASMVIKQPIAEQGTRLNKLVSPLVSEVQPKINKLVTHISKIISAILETGCPHLPEELWLHILTFKTTFYANGLRSVKAPTGNPNSPYNTEVASPLLSIIYPKDTHPADPQEEATSSEQLSGALLKYISDHPQDIGVTLSSFSMKRVDDFSH